MFIPPYLNDGAGIDTRIRKSESCETGSVGTILFTATQFYRNLGKLRVQLQFQFQAFTRTPSTFFHPFLCPMRRNAPPGLPGVIGPSTTPGQQKNLPYSREIRLHFRPSCFSPPFHVPMDSIANTGVILIFIKKTKQDHNLCLGAIQYIQCIIIR